MSHNVSEWTDFGRITTKRIFLNIQCTEKYATIQIRILRCNHLNDIFEPIRIDAVNRKRMLHVQCTIKVKMSWLLTKILLETIISSSVHEQEMNHFIQQIYQSLFIATGRCVVTVTESNRCMRLCALLVWIARRAWLIAFITFQWWDCLEKSIREN